MMGVRSESFLNLYHGTDSISAERILNEGFRPSPSKGSWCGSGVYFYDIKAKAWWSAQRTCDSLKKQIGQAIKPEVLKADVQSVDRNDILDLRAPDDVRDFKELVDKLTGHVIYETDELTDYERVILLRSMLIDYYATVRNKKMIVGVFKQREREDMSDVIEYGEELFFVLGVETIYCVRDTSIISHIRRSAES